MKSDDFRLVDMKDTKGRLVRKHIYKTTNGHWDLTQEWMAEVLASVEEGYELIKDESFTFGLRTAPDLSAFVVLPEYYKALEEPKVEEKATVKPPKVKKATPKPLADKEESVVIPEPISPIIRLKEIKTLDGLAEFAADNDIVIPEDKKVFRAIQQYLVNQYKD